MTVYMCTQKGSSNREFKIPLQDFPSGPGLGLHFPMQEAQVQWLVRDLVYPSAMGPRNPNIEQNLYCNSIKIFKMNTT